MILMKICSYCDIASQLYLLFRSKLEKPRCSLSIKHEDASLALLALILVQCIYRVLYLAVINRNVCFPFIFIYWPNSVPLLRQSNLIISFLDASSHLSLSRSVGQVSMPKHIAQQMTLFCLYVRQLCIQCRCPF